MLHLRKILLVMMMMGAFYLSHAQLKIGAGVPEITLPNPSGDSISLSDFKGKVVLIDFWASWCGPCRAANPFIQKLYKKYKDQGFVVFAVSLDTKKENWLRAIKKDKLTYPQVLDLDGWNSGIAERFFVDALPTNFLLDRSGKIVAINIEGKELFDRVKLLVN